jgi:hypothetical protein
MRELSTVSAIFETPDNEIYLLNIARNKLVAACVTPEFVARNIARNI